MSEHLKRRRDQLRKVLRKQNIGAVAIWTERNVTWLTGFTGDSTVLLIGDDVELMISDFRYDTQLEEECRGIATLIRGSSQRLVDAVGGAVQQRGVKRLGFESHLLSVETAGQLHASCPGTELVPLSGTVEELRAVKDAVEIAEIREAVRIAERGFDYLKAVLTPQKTERILAAELEFAIRQFGADRLSFPAIIAVGDRASMPHSRPTDAPLSTSPLLLVDWGATTRNGYRSDLTRVLLTGKPDRKCERVYKTVLEAQLRAIESIGPGVKCGDVDAAARKVIEKAGYGKNFDHGTGHGIGLDIHEMPRLSRGSETVLRPGMVVTVEPGIYLPGWGGVRIEDDVLVTSRGYEVLSAVPKSWETAHVRI